MTPNQRCQMGNVVSYLKLKLIIFWGKWSYATKVRMKPSIPMFQSCVEIPNWLSVQRDTFQWTRALFGNETERTCVKLASHNVTFIITSMIGWKSVKWEEMRKHRHDPYFTMQITTDNNVTKWSNDCTSCIIDRTSCKCENDCTFGNTSLNEGLSYHMSAGCVNIFSGIFTTSTF